MPAKFKCEPGDEVKWAHVQGIMQDIRSLAEDYNYTYASPVDEVTSVWSVAAAPDSVTVAMHFAVVDGEIVDTRIAPALGSVAAWELPEPYMQELVDAGDLIAILEEDDCLCKTMWKVVPAAAGYTLKAVENLSDGCCPTLEVPAKGEVLKAGPFIPSAALGRRLRSVNGWRSTATCRLGGASMIGYTSGRVTGVQRQMQLRLSWVIRKAHFDRLEAEWHKVIYQAPGFTLRTPESFELSLLTFGCGSVLNLNLAAGVVPVVPAGAAGCVLAKMLHAWKTNRNSDLAFESAWGTSPGCVSVADPTAAASWIKPWKTPTCAADACDSLQRVYCNTLQWMNNMVTMARRMLCPRLAAEGFDWSTQTSVSVVHTISEHVSVDVTVGSSLVVHAERTATAACGGAHTEFSGLAVRVSVRPLCGPRKFWVNISGDAHTKEYREPPDSSCSDPFEAYTIWQGNAWIGSGSSAGWRYRAGRTVDTCTEVYPLCDTDDLNVEDGTPESPVVTSSQELIVDFSEFNLSSISCTITITPVET